MAKFGTAKAIILFEKYLPLNKANAAIGTKFGGCGKNLTNAARKTIPVITKNLGLYKFVFIIKSPFYDKNIFKSIV